MRLCNVLFLSMRTKKLNEMASYTKLVGSDVLKNLDWDYFKSWYSGPVRCKKELIYVQTKVRG